MVKPAGSAHFMLLQLITADNNNLCRPIFIQHDADEFLAKRTGTAGDKDGFIRPIHNFS